MVSFFYAQKEKCSTKYDYLELGEENERSDSIFFSVPVMFHVLYNNEAENIPDSLIKQALKTLQEDFTVKNEDINAVPDRFIDAVGNPKIKFFLATKLPDGNPTNGIIRTYTDIQEFNHKKRNCFNISTIIEPSKYLNIYICDLNTAGSTPTGSAIRSNNKHNGIRVDYKYVGGGKRTITHEVGHWLSLYHTFEGGCKNKDMVHDTPAQKKSWTCYKQGKRQCRNYIMVSNYMGYARCRNFFSKGQVQRMHNYINKYKKFDYAN